MSDYFISTSGQKILVSLLREIPSLVEDLSITLCRLDRTGKGGMKVSSGSDEQPLPLNMAASDAKDELHSELATWARLVCESRGIAYDGEGSVLGIARWLDENVISLAMTEGSEEAYVGIEKAMARCRRAMDIAPANRVLLGLCPKCSTRVDAEVDDDRGMCRTCGGEFTKDEGRTAIDREMEMLILPAKAAAELISVRYGAAIKPKTVHDMGYRKKNPVMPTELADGTTAFPVGRVIEDLMRRGKIA